MLRFHIYIRVSVFGFVRKHMDTTMCRHGSRIVLSSSSSPSSSRVRSFLIKIVCLRLQHFIFMIYSMRERERERRHGWKEKNFVLSIVGGDHSFFQQKPFPAPARQEFIAFIWSDMEMHTRLSPPPLSTYMNVMNYLFPRHIFVFRHYCVPAMATGMHPGAI